MKLNQTAVLREALVLNVCSKIESEENCLCEANTYLLMRRQSNPLLICSVSQRKLSFIEFLHAECREIQIVDFQELEEKLHGTLQQKRNWPHFISVPKKTIKAQPKARPTPRMAVPSELQQGGRGSFRFSYFYCSFPSPQWSYFNQDEGKDIETYWRYQ